MSEVRAPKVYAKGMSLKQKNYGHKNKIGISINVEKFIQFLHENVNEKGWVNIQAWSNDEVGKFGETHTATIDDWKPTARTEAPDLETGGNGDDLPF